MGIGNGGIQRVRVSSVARRVLVRCTTAGGAAIFLLGHDGHGGEGTIAEQGIGGAYHHRVERRRGAEGPVIVLPTDIWWLCCPKHVYFVGDPDLNEHQI